MKTTLRRPSAERASPPTEGGQQRRVLAIAGLLIAGFLVFFPMKQLLEMRTRTARLEARLSALHEENAELSAEVERLRDPERLELLARERLGLVRPGERMYVFVPTPPPPTQPQPTPEPSTWAKVWSWLGDLVRGGG